MKKPKEKCERIVDGNACGQEVEDVGDSVCLVTGSDKQQERASVCRLHWSEIMVMFGL